MPKYQYECKDCGEALEVQQSFTDDALTVCPNCQGNLRKVFNAVGVVFKGSGFYRNDSRSTSTSSDAAKPAAKESAPSAPAPAPAKKAGKDSAA
ncbi:FmdB family transcriptional regulator [Aeromicrobium sp. A1-2]|uniref:FmdB family zinc ribbon protein n=1 Tax=Aeromicrobium sp. A1-2 TaxID=2107713 RepID=UPI000E53D885|nr:FmdB family zinc ribbon protein [Aeromicrobium sp. A1-2]AXT85913.1 FmdB family transcriptional regulator [Aeromicrobium sp. A1-2]